MRNETCFTKPESALNNDMADICKLAIYPLEYTSHTCAQISIQANQRKMFSQLRAPYCGWIEWHSDNL